MHLTEKHFTRVANIGVIVACFSRAAGYSSVLGEPRDSPGPSLLSDDGRLLWVYVVLWAIGGILALVDLVAGRLGSGIMICIVLLGWWTFSYFLAWVASHFHSWDWLSVGIYSAAMLIISGLLGALVEARKKNQRFIDGAKTGAIQQSAPPGSRGESG